MSFANSLYWKNRLKRSSVSWNFTQQYYSTMGVKLFAVLVFLLWTVANAQEIPPPARTSCTSNFFPGQRNVLLNIKAEFSLDQRENIETPEACKNLCLIFDLCRSVTHLRKTKRCYLNLVNKRDDKAETIAAYNGLKITLYERDCSVPVAIQTRCSTVFDQQRPKTLLNLTSTHSQRVPNIHSIQACSALCLSDNKCRSITYGQSTKLCYINSVNDRDDKVGVQGTSSDFTLMERQCTEPSCGIQSPKHQPVFHRIVGGEEAKPHSWPWTVALQYSNGIECGGSIIGKRWILTAKHCLYRDPPPIAVVVGAHTIARQEASQRVYNSFRFHTYPHGSHDIALIELLQDIEYTDEVRPICMPSNSASRGEDYIATGWGDTYGTGRVDVLNQVDLKLIPYHLCSRRPYYGTRIYRTTMICAGYKRGGKDTCGGDSGGPLMRYTGSQGNRGRYVLYGVTSFGGRQCAAARKPGVYMNVHHFVNWIQSTTNNAAEIS